MSLPDHSSILHAVSDAHPHLIEQNTSATMTELLWRVSVAMHAHDANWGLLSKSAGENHTVIAGQRVSVDALAYGNADEIVDIFRATGDGPGEGGLTWSIDERRPSNVRITPPPFPGAPAPGPVDPPPPVTPPPVTPPPPTVPPVTDTRALVALERIATACERIADKPVPVAGGSTVNVDQLVEQVLVVVVDRLLKPAV
jgi:hypothetical protein